MKDETRNETPNRIHKKQQFRKLSLVIAPSSRQ
jgi:hypothetical protein